MHVRVHAASAGMARVGGAAEAKTRPPRKPFKSLVPRPRGGRGGLQRTGTHLGTETRPHQRAHVHSRERSQVATLMLMLTGTQLTHP